MKASWDWIPKSELNAVNGDVVAKQNSEALEKMMLDLATGKNFVSAGHNSSPRQRPEEGLPLRGCNELMPLPNLPDYDNSPFEIGIACTGL